MKETKKILFVIFVQIIIISILTSKIIKRKNAELSINTLSKNLVNIQGLSTLKYFYDLNPDIIETNQPFWLPEKVIYTFNNDALNERFNYSTDKLISNYRIITLGDSFTFGQYVNTADNWTELLEDLLNNKLKCKNYKKIEVINLGVPGYDIQYAVERYYIRGQKYDPDLILWMLIDNNRLLEKMTPLLANCEFKNKPIDADISNKCWRDAKNKFEKEFGSEKLQNLLVDNFNQIFSIYKNKIITINFDAGHRDILSKIDYKDKIIIYDFYLKDQSFYLPDGHPNKKGHQKIAEDIFKYLEKNKIISCD